jgi:3-oxoacyl-[acyl-carrier-protein] synthase-3
MGTRIAAVSALTGHGKRKSTARQLADAAARDCLTHAGRQPSEVGLLINTGVYREDSMGEPALAALVQEDIGANLGQSPATGHGTFSFDLINGTCGVTSAIQIANSMLSSGVIQLGAIVTSDVGPELQGRPAAPFRSAGGAMLLSWDDGIAGFTDFHTETFPEYHDLFASGLVWQDRRGRPVPRRTAGRSLMVIDERPGYQARLVDCAEDVTRRFLSRLGMDLGDIDLLVPAPCTAGFVDPLRVRLGVPGDRVAYVAEDLAGSYSAGPIAALQAAIRSGRLGEARNILILTAGAGITVAAALYRQSPP